MLTAALAEALSDQDAAIFCLGTYTGAVSGAELRKTTVDYTIEFARVLHGSSPNAVFDRFSGSGADQTGRSRIAFARDKEEAEKALIGRVPARLHVCLHHPVELRKEPNLLATGCRDSPVFRVLFPPGDSGLMTPARAMVMLLS